METKIEKDMKRQELNEILTKKVIRENKLCLLNRVHRRNKTEDELFPFYDHDEFNKGYVFVKSYKIKPVLSKGIMSKYHYE